MPAERGQISNDTVAEGSYITDQQVKSRSAVAVIGPTTATNLFGDHVRRRRRRRSASTGSPSPWWGC